MNKYKNPCNLDNFAAKNIELAQGHYFAMPDLSLKCRISYFGRKRKKNKNLESVI